MIVSKKKTKTTQIVVVEKLICNKCGKKCNSGRNNRMVNGATFLASFGYGSNKGDTAEHFHLCDDCYDEIVKTFKHNPDPI